MGKGTCQAEQQPLRGRRFIIWGHEEPGLRKKASKRKMSHAHQPPVALCTSHSTSARLIGPLTVLRGSCCHGDSEFTCPRPHSSHDLLPPEQEILMIKYKLTFPGQRCGAYFQVSVRTHARDYGKTYWKKQNESKRASDFVPETRFPRAWEGILRGRAPRLRGQLQRKKAPHRVAQWWSIRL